MLSTVRRWLGGGGDAGNGRRIAQAGDGRVEVGGHVFDLRTVTTDHAGFPRPDWWAVLDWVDAQPEAAQGACWNAARRAWLCMLRDALGGNHHIYESDEALLLSAQPPRIAETTLDAVRTAFARVRRLLGPLALGAPDAKEILVLFADEAAYYRYIGYYYPEAGEFAMSSGMHVGGPGHHFMTCDADLTRMEGVIAHELTHSCLRHLPLPAWLNEGMAVNTEQRLTRTGDDVYTVRELEAKHRAFWTEDTIQEFWSGASYVRGDEANQLSYDLGRLLVNGLAADWDGFIRFALQANADDGGARAAHEMLDLDLGEAVQRFLGRDDGDWSPRPAAWPQAPERGGFRLLQAGRRVGVVPVG